MSKLAHAAGLAYRHAGDAGAPAALLVHGYPESSYMWTHALAALAGAGWRALAPDLPGYGDSELGAGGGSWERHIDALDRFVGELDPGPVALVTHDWGVPIGLRWACDRPGAAGALVISDGGFFSDRRWHDLANVMRTPEEGEKLIRAYTAEGFHAAMRAVSAGMSDAAIEHYWKAFADDERRLAQLQLYRSGEFEKLVPYEGRLAALDLPALILWGAQDRFAGVSMARRFHAELTGSELLVLEDAGHFVWDDEPERTCGALVDFLSRRASSVRSPSAGRAG
ncbi:MAG TPA: alpha/beta fold hydrolase [Solirubrobacteraceae bacterium]|nr:alpha/beta fold hydrolase [Solirubrobacteraceae bacterium]